MICYADLLRIDLQTRAATTVDICETGRGNVLLPCGTLQRNDWRYVRYVVTCGTGSQKQSAKTTSGTGLLVLWRYFVSYIKSPSIEESKLRCDLPNHAVAEGSAL
jgi:hypothetical protein